MENNMDHETHLKLLAALDVEHLGEMNKELFIKLLTTPLIDLLSLNNDFRQAEEGLLDKVGLVSCVFSAGFLHGAHFGRTSSHPVGEGFPPNLEAQNEKEGGTN